jgi:hypothetical protein
MLGLSVSPMATTPRESAECTVYRNDFMKIGLFALAGLLMVGCQGPFGLGGPPSPQDIASKPGQSSMQDGHFKVTAVIVNGATHTTGSGDGVLALKGKVGLKLNIQVSAGLLNVGVDLIATGGKDYERIGNGAWTVTTDTASPGNASHGTPSYVGESQIGNDKAWHIRSKQSGTTYDEWVRESDGYLLKYGWQADTGSFTMDFDQFNIGADIAAPSQKEIAASQYQALADTTNPLVDSADNALTAAANANDLAAYKAALQSAISAERQFHDGLEKISFPADMQPDVQTLVTADQGLIAVFQAETQAASWTQINFDTETKAGNTLHDAVVKVRADLGLPPPTS